MALVLVDYRLVLPRAAVRAGGVGAGRGAVCGDALMGEYRHGLYLTTGRDDRGGQDTPAVEGSAVTPARRSALWSWHAQCVANADRAKARGDKREWHAWSQAAAEVLQELV